MMTVTAYAAYAILRLYGVYHGSRPLHAFIMFLSTDTVCLQIVLHVTLGQTVSP